MTPKQDLVWCVFLSTLFLSNFIFLSFLGRGNSPPVPTLRPSQGEGNSSNNSEFESASMGLSSDDDQVQQHRRKKLDF